MSKLLAIPKGMKVVSPRRDPDLVSKRGVDWWFAPDWVRATNSDGTSYQRIRAVKVGNDTHIFTVSKSGNTNYVQGSIQQEFKTWCEDREIDCILLGMELEDILSTDWEYE